MRVLVVEDEPLVLAGMKRMLDRIPEIQEIFGFYSGAMAMDWLEDHEVDMAFLDICLADTSGLTLIEKIRILSPECYVVMCSGYDEYALEAFRHHANGYLMKPVKEEDILREIRFYNRMSSSYLLRIQCFGYFEAFDKSGKPLPFKRSKTKELLALLVDSRGSGISSKRICSIIWKDDGFEDKKNMIHLWQLFSDLRKTLHKVGAESVFMNSGIHHMIDTKLVSCDYYDYLNGKNRQKYMGEYMIQYSWAETTAAWLEKTYTP